MAEENSGGPVAKTLPGADAPPAKVIVLHETVFRSWCRDAVTFGWLLGGLWLNHHHLGGSWIVTLTLCIGLFVFAFGNIKADKVTIDEAIRTLQAMQAARQRAEARSARPSSGGSHPTPPPPEPTKGSP